MNIYEALDFADNAASDNTDIRVYLSNARIVFDGGRYGSHDIDIRTSSPQRAAAHFVGYCEQNDCKVVPRSSPPLRFATDLLPLCGHFRAFWSARAILTGSMIDLLPDRQYSQGSPDDRMTLAHRLNGADGLLNRFDGVRHVVRALLTYRHMSPAEWQPFELIRDDGVRIWGNTNGSFGYLYLLAYWGKGEPDVAGPPIKRCSYKLDNHDYPAVDFIEESTP